jgi:hypothetical protein
MKSMGLGIVVALCLSFSGCADSSGLHNQEASRVSFVLKNIPAPDGSYALPGEYQDSQWDNATAAVELKGGKGSSSAMDIAKSSFTFSLVPVGEWTRPWYPEMKGNAYDYNSGGKQWNFSIAGLPLGRDVTVTIDGGASPASIVIE